MGIGNRHGEIPPGTKFTEHSTTFGCQVMALANSVRSLEGKADIWCRKLDVEAGQSEDPFSHAPDMRRVCKDILAKAVEEARKGASGFVHWAVRYEQDLTPEAKDALLKGGEVLCRVLTERYSLPTVRLEHGRAFSVTFPIR